MRTSFVSDERELAARNRVEFQHCDQAKPVPANEWVVPRGQAEGMEWNCVRRDWQEERKV
jgi:hypothetical protein